MKIEDLKKTITNVPDFPHPPVVYRDLTTLLMDPEALREAMHRLQEKAHALGNFDIVVGIESRGFILGTPLAYILNKGFVIARKQGKLPRATISITYETEYGPDTIEMHQDAIKPGQKVLLVDDLLATGGTALAVCDLLEQLQGDILGCLFLNELTSLKGRQLLARYKVESVIVFD